MDITTKTELAKSAVELLLSIGSLLAGLWLIGKKITSTIKKYTSQVDIMFTGFQAFSVKQENLERAFDQMGRNFFELSQKIDYRDKDLAKLEGALDASRKDLVNLISSVQQSVSSTDALWRTLQTLFPAQVPRRASDKRVEVENV